jgi:hypothetical protein
MNDVVGGGSELSRLQAAVDAELVQAQASQDPAALVEPELEKYAIRLQGLRDAVGVLESYDEGIDQD